LINPILLFLWK